MRESSCRSRRRSSAAPAGSRALPMAAPGASTLPPTSSSPAPNDHIALRTHGATRLDVRRQFQAKPDIRSRNSAGFGGGGCRRRPPPLPHDTVIDVLTSAYSSRLSQTDDQCAHPQQARLPLRIGLTNEAQRSLRPPHLRGRRRRAFRFTHKCGSDAHKRSHPRKENEQCMHPNEH